MNNFFFSAIHITLTTSKGNNLTTCEREIKSYARNSMSGNEIVRNTSDLERWDQHMINAFYKYSLDKSVLPKIHLRTFELQLIGLTENVKKAKEKYHLMSEILKLKSAIRIPPTIIPRASVPDKHRVKSASNTDYNIAFSYSPQDEAICQHLAVCLIAEGYSLCQSSSDTFLSQAQVERSDLVLIYMSEKYSQDAHCMSAMNDAKSMGKKIISITSVRSITQDTQDDAWLRSMIHTQLSWDLFDTEIEVEFMEDFHLEYDRLLTLLVSGKILYLTNGIIFHSYVIQNLDITGQVYPQSSIIPEANDIDANYEHAAFGYISIKLQRMTDEQRKERERTYHLRLKEQIENEKISNGEINTLVGDLVLVVEDLEEILKGNNPDDHIPWDHRQKYAGLWTQSKFGGKNKGISSISFF